MNNKFINGKIYALKSNSHPEYIYVGTTICYLDFVMSALQSTYKQKNVNKSNYSAFELLKYPDCRIELLEAYPCNSRKELSTRGGWYIRNNSCVNKKILGRDKKTYHQDNIESIHLKQKKYYRNVDLDKARERGKIRYQKNKEKLREKNRLYCINNKEKIREKNLLNY